MGLPSASSSESPKDRLSPNFFPLLLRLVLSSFPVGSGPYDEAPPTPS